MYHNVQSLTNKLQELEIILSSDLNADVICITEHWLEKHQIESLKIPGYSLINSFCRIDSIRGGTAIFAKQNLRYKAIQAYPDLIKEKVFEMSAIELIDKHVIIVTIYRSPDGDIEEFLCKFEIMLNMLETTKKKIICGDFNVDFLKPSNYKEELTYITKSFNLIPTVNTPTRITEHSRTTPDQMFVQETFPSYNSKVVKMGYSDHEAVLLTLELCPEKISPIKIIEFRDFSDGNIANFCNILNWEKWNEIFDETDVNKMFSSFHETYKYYFDIAFPIQQRKLKQGKNKSWITSGIITSSRRKRYLHSYKKQNHLSLDMQIYIKEYNKIYRKVIKEAKRRGNDDYIRKSKNKTQATWNIIRNETGTQPVAKSITLKLKNRQVSDATSVANIFNEYFSKIADDLIQRNFQTPSTNHTENYKPPKGSMFLRQVTGSELMLTMNTLKKLSCGFDGIPDCIISQTRYQIAEPLMHIINHSFTTGTFPDLLKIAKVTPLHKKGATDDVNNYRPVAQLSGFSKIFEKLFYNRLIEFINKNSLLSNHQHGFRQSRSTTTAIYEYLHSILKAIDEKEMATGIFLDLSKAFDVIDHDILLHKLECKGIRGISNEWIRTYLTNRQQSVVLKQDTTTGNISRRTTHTSEKTTIKYGVPQGSTLGPILFLLYIDDLNDTVHAKQKILFADDTSILITGLEQKHLQLSTDTSLLELTHWFNKNKLIINTEKTVAMNFHLSHHKQQSNHTLKINDRSLTLVDDVKFLGIYLQSDLKWNTHTKTLSAKLSSICYMLRILNTSCSREIVMQAYHAHFQSAIRYGIIFWGNAPCSQSVFKTQKRAVRIICNMKRQDSCRSLFPTLKILNIPCLYIFETIVFIKYYLGSTSAYQLNSSVHSHRTRNDKNIHVSYARTSAYQKSVLHRGTQLYNHLPGSIKLIKEESIFKQKLKSFLMDRSFYSVDEFLAE